MSAEDETSTPQPRPPSLLDALAPVVVLIALTIGLFGVSATDGPLQVALLLSEQEASRAPPEIGVSASLAAGGAQTTVGP